MERLAKETRYDVRSIRRFMNELIEHGLIERTLRKKPGDRKYNDKSIFRITGSLPRYAPDTSDDSFDGDLHRIAIEAEDLTKEQFLEKCEAAYNKAKGLPVGNYAPMSGQNSRAFWRLRGERNY